MESLTREIARRCCLQPIAFFRPFVFNLCPGAVSRFRPVIKKHTIRAFFHAFWLAEKRWTDITLVTQVKVVY